jgi:hypothetical protein
MAYCKKFAEQIEDIIYCDRYCDHTQDGHKECKHYQKEA